MEYISFPRLGLSFPINPTAFTIFGFSVQWYGLLIAVGFLLAFLYYMRRAKSFGVDPDKFVDIILFAIIGGIAGARAYYCIFSGDGITSFFDFDFSEGIRGLAVYGGLIGGILVAVIACKIHKIRVLPALDLAGICFLIAQCIGRWGNFFNMEAFGSNTTLPWGMWSETISDYLSERQYDLAELGIAVTPSSPVHPTFLYESLWCLAGFVLLHFLSKKRRYDGQIFLYYIAWYGFGRFWIEGLRTDSLMIGRIRVSQLLAALLVVASVVILIVMHSKITRSGDPQYRACYINTEGWIEEQRITEEKREARKAKKERKRLGLDKIEPIDEAEDAAEETDEPDTVEADNIEQESEENNNLGEDDTDEHEN